MVRILRGSHLESPKSRAYLPKIAERITPSLNTVGVCNQITLLILYCISSRLVTVLKVNDAPIQVPNIFFYLTISFKSSILAFRYSFSFFLKCQLASCLALFRLSTLLSFGSCNHYILACFLLSKKPKHFSSKQFYAASVYKDLHSL